MQTWQESLSTFILFKRAEGRSHYTVRDYRRIVGAFFRRPEAQSAWPDADRLRRAVLQHFTDIRGLAASYHNQQLRVLRSFFNWAADEGLVSGNPTKGIKQRREDQTPRHLPDDILSKLLRLPNQSAFVGVRDFALMLFQLDSGVRPGEALQLTPRDLNLASLEITIPAHVAKARVSRTVVISPQTAKAIRKLLSVRPADWDDSVPVFASASGRKLAEESWSRIMRQYGRKLGARVTPYMLRHSSAIMFLRSGGHVFALQRQLGHADITMTRRYIALADADLHEQHAVASPVSRLLPQRTRARKVK
ncbi:tyrosine-type recombinase/integrase [Kyrpidia sp.]|uniref:tyrosine-type recombinase/integrase n=1 Tax=Kyrpidia sp. TaxID=2073077 RepID=UPI00258E499F|nr:tyrosine-type recombinase/integrase [Kyrpidia sp.]MCL6576865.1 tyrosine-type recombinase/integrase [Kyrpidia sp.]